LRFDDSGREFGGLHRRDKIPAGVDNVKNIASRGMAHVVAARRLRESERGEAAASLAQIGAWSEGRSSLRGPLSMPTVSSRSAA
jgi:hypothetical protein